MTTCKPSFLLQFRRLTVLTGTLLLVPVPALAYLDPTTGSMVISAIVGLFASLVLAIKTYWYRINAWFKRKPAQTDSGVDTSAGGDTNASPGDGVT